jgi:hypothetical protein
MYAPDRKWEEPMEAQTESLAAFLERTPGVVRAMLAGIPEDLIRATEGGESWSPFDRFAQFEASRGSTLEDLLDEFQVLRTANLEAHRALLNAGIDLDATGTHPEFGQVRAGELLATRAVHDLGHIARAARVVAKQFGEDAGPWSTYLPVLRDR